MSFELSFSPEFFFAEGEPYDRDEYTDEEKERPYSVWMALSVMPDDEYRELVASCFLQSFLKPGEYAGGEIQEDLPDLRDVFMTAIQNVNTCSNLTTPVEVWIDAEGHHTIRVWDGPHEVCTVCGEMITVTGKTTDGRLIGSCGDAFYRDVDELPTTLYLLTGSTSLWPYVSPCGAETIQVGEAIECDDCTVAEAERVISASAKVSGVQTTRFRVEPRGWKRCRITRLKDIE